MARHSDGAPLRGTGTVTGAVCADIGGSFIRAGWVDGTQVRLLGRFPTPATDWNAFTATLAELLSGTPPELPLGISVAGVPGPGGEVRAANIPCLAGRPVAAELATRLRRPVALANDADCFALAEADTGAGTGHRVVLGIILGTGVGGGLVVDGRVVPGAGEWGHGPAVRHGPLADLPCPCGTTGCLDGVGGARGLERLHTALHGQAADSHAVLARWAAGDPAAGRTVGQWLDLVAGPLAFAVNLTAATVVPAGGGLGAVPALMAELDALVRTRCLSPPPSGTALVRPARHGGDAGLIGAAVLALAPPRRS